MSFTELFSRCYDELTFNVGYGEMCAFIQKQLSLYPQTNNIILDAGCGTGSLCLLLSNCGYEMIGADASIDMLMQARQTCVQASTPVLFLNQSMEQLDLYGTIGAAVCTLDTINHIINIDELQRSINKISLFTEPGGLFIFDVNTRYKHEQILGNQSFIYDMDGVYCGWQNEYNPEEHKTDIYLSFFEEQEGLYSREDEQFSERWYSDAELTQVLAAAKYKVLARYGGYDCSQICDTTQRVVYVAQKGE